MLNRANLKTAATMASPVISFPPNTAQRWTLANGLTLIVQEDRSAPVASVQAWCATGSTTEDKHLGAGLSHILEHMLFKGTKTRSTNEIAQKIQDVGGYINAYTSFDRTVFWIDVPKEGALTALDILADAMMIANSRRITSCSLAYSCGGRVEFIIASARISSAVSAPSFGTSIQKTVRSNEV